MYKHEALTTVTIFSGMAGSDAARGHKPWEITALIGAYQRVAATPNLTVGSGCVAQFVRH